MIVSALQQLLAAHNQVAPRLARWDYGDCEGPRPAVFTVDPPPADCKDPLLVITLEDVEEIAQSRKGPIGERHTVQVVLWGGGDRTETAVRLLAQASARAIRKAEPDLSGSGFEFSSWSVKGPARIRDEQGYAGYALTVTADALELEAGA